MKNKMLTSGLILIASIAVHAATMPCFAVFHQPKTPSCVA